MALTVKAGGTYVLTHAEGLGQGLGSIPTGTAVTVESLHKEPTAGVGGDVVVSIPNEVVIDGERYYLPRRVALSASDFQRLFDKAGK